VKKFLIPLATAVAALISQQSLAADNSRIETSHLPEIIHPATTLALQISLSATSSDLILTKPTATFARYGHSSHSSHRSHGSHRSHRSGR
jgi:hypothetical protein